MTEQELIQHAQQGNTSCFTQLVLLYQPKIHSYLLARCTNPTDADDVLQDTFINAFKYIKSFDDQWAFSTWLFTIAKRQLSRVKHYPHMSLDVVEHHSEAMPHPENNIWPLIKKHVSPEQHDLLWFFYVEEMTSKELAHVMKKSESWVKTNLHRSKIKLKNLSAIQELMRSPL